MEKFIISVSSSYKNYASNIKGPIWPKNWIFVKLKYFYSLPSFPSALQLRVSFGLLNNLPPFFSILHLSSSSFHFPFTEIIVYILFAIVDFRSIHPFEADYLLSEQFSFCGVRLLASRPNSNLEDQSIPLRLAPTPWPVRHGWPYQ
jgi:hypothetical protein